MSPSSIEKRENRLMRELVGPGDMLLIDLIREFIDREIMPLRREMEASTRGDFALVEEVQKKLVGLGFQGAFLPPEYGGWNLTSALTYCVIVEEFGRGEPACIAALGGGAWAFRPAVIAGNRALLEDFAPRFTGGEPYVACFAMTEPSGGCNIENVDMHGKGIHTRAVLDGDEWVIDGAKVWPTNSGIADVYCVVCNTDPDLGDEGIALIYVPVPTEGFSFGRFEDKAGFRASREGDFYFDAVRVPRAYRAAGPGEDAEMLLDNLAFSRLLAAASCVGAAKGAFEEVLDFTSERLAAGKPIRQHSVCACMLADIATSIQAGRDCYACAARVFDLAGRERRASTTLLSRPSLARHYCGQAAVEATNRAMELMGSYGYVTDYHVEKYWRDARTLQLCEVVPQQLKMDTAGGYYRLDPLHPNPLYEKMHRS